MTAALATWGGDAMPDGVAIGPAQTPSYFTTPDRARQITDRARAAWQTTRHGAATLIDALAEAWRTNTHLVLDFPTWHAYVEHIVDGDLRDLRLSGSDEAVVVRRALEASLHDSGLKYRQIRDRLGVSLGTIRADIGAPAIDLEPEPAPTGRVYEQAAEYLRRQGDRGLTRLELALEAGWSEGKAGGALADTIRVGLGCKVERWRLGQRVFVALAEQQNG